MKTSAYFGILALILAAIFGLFRVERQPSKSLAANGYLHTEPTSTALLDPSLVSDARAPVQAPTLDSWTEQLVQARTADESKIDLSAVREFNQWALDELSGKAITPLRIQELAQARQESLKNLIKKDPQLAWEQMLPPAVLASLPTTLQTFLEEPIEGAGDWNVFSACHWEASTCGHNRTESHSCPDLPSIIHKATIGDKTYDAFPIGHLVQVTSIKTVQLEGFAIDSTAVFNAMPLEQIEAESHRLAGNVSHVGTDSFDSPVINPEETQTAASLFNGGSSGAPSESELMAAAPASSITGQPDSLPLTNREGGVATGGQSTGYRTLLYMRVTFADQPNDVVQTEASVYSNLQTVNEHLLESSWGRMQILPTVTPVIVLPENQSYYANASQGVALLGSDARQVAIDMGYDPSQYGHRVYRYNGSPGTFGGFANIGNNPGDLWVRFSTEGLLVHELGHNLKLFHSNGWDTDLKASIGPSSSIEYGHGYCVMAENYNLNDTGFCAFQKQRLGWLKDSEYVESLVSGRHRIYAIDDSTIDPDKHYAIQVPTPNRGSYWLEYRNNYNNTAFRNGLLLQAQGPGWTINQGIPHRIDVTYWSKKDTSDSPIPIGWTFSDHEQGVHITPVARSTDYSWIDVQVHHEQDFSTNSPPTAMLTASNTNPAVGESVDFTLSNISDADGDELCYYWYFDNQVYQNFSWSTFTARSRSWSAAGVYNVIAVVSDMKGGTCFKSIPITVGTPTDFSISGQIIDHAGNGVAGVAVSNGLGLNDSDYRATLTDEDGNYVIGSLPAASYTVRARKDFDTYGTRGFTNPVVVGPSAVDVGFRARALQVTATGAPAEGGAVGQFTISRVKLANNFASDISFRVSTSGDAIENTDYTLSPAPVNGVYFMASNIDSLTLTVTAVDDSNVEGPEDVVLSLGMLDNVSVVNSTTTKATLLIEDNESADPRVRAIPMSRAMAEDGGSAEVLFIRYGDTTNALTVNIGTDAAPGLAEYGVDYAFDTGVKSIVIPAGASTAVLQVLAINDTELEGYEKTQFRLNNGTGYVRDRDPSNIFIDIHDDEIPTVTVDLTDNNTGEGNNSVGTIRFTRDPISPLPLSINYGVAGVALHGTDYQQLSGQITIPAGAASAEVTIAGLPDALIEGSELATVRASVSDQFDYFLNSNAFEESVSVNDKPILSLEGPSAPFSELSPSSAQFTINRVGPTGAITITIESIGLAQGGLDFTFPASVDLPANTTSVSFDVTPLTDSVAEGLETITLNLVPQTAYGVDTSPSASQVIEDLPVDDWRFDKFGADANTPSIAGDQADPDKDGLANLYEFGTLSEPLIINLADLEPDLASGEFSIEFKRRKDAGITVQCLQTNSLSPNVVWSSTGVTEEILEDTATYTRVRASIPVTSNPGFLKVEVAR